MGKLEDAKAQQLKAGQDLEQTITRLVKELYRLSGKTYELIDPELEKLIQGEKALAMYLEAVAIYLKCPGNDTDVSKCEKCPINDKQYAGDTSICALLSRAAGRVKK